MSEAYITYTIEVFEEGSLKHSYTFNAITIKKESILKKLKHIINLVKYGKRR